MNDLTDLLKIEGTEINHFFMKASVEGKGTPQEVADRREAALTNFIKRYFPFPYRVAKGNIIDSYGKRSASIDCIILNPKHPYTTTDDSKFSIILADGVDVAIELKPNFGSEKEIFRSLGQVKSVKELTRQKNGIIKLPTLNPKPGDNKYNVTDEYYSNCMKIPCVIFSTKTYTKVEVLLEKICTYYETNSIKREKQFDIIVVNNNFLILNSKKDSYIHLKEFSDGMYVFDYGDLTLAAFLMRLNLLPQSEMRVSKSVLSAYLKIKAAKIRTVESINERLQKI